MVMILYSTRGAKQNTNANGPSHNSIGSQSLKLRKGAFWLNNKPFRILSGALHYFRVPPNYWSDRLKKAKAMGLNTVETYIPWFLHELLPGTYEFSGILDLEQFLVEAKKEKLYVIVRPGPYICSELDFGGLPSWLLLDNNMKIRSMYPGFIGAVDRYLNVIMEKLKRHQKSIYNGPIIAFQIENEYGSYDNDPQYIQYLHDGFRNRGIVELLFTSDNSDGLLKVKSRIPGVLPTLNGWSNLDSNIETLKTILPNGYPIMVMEFWVGWFTVWGQKPQNKSANEVMEALKKLLSMGASVNIYMFHGGTNFGFINGALESSRDPMITSYDYDAPLTENGDITLKYVKLRSVLTEFHKDIVLPDVPPNIEVVAYDPVTMHLYIPLVETFLPTPIENDKLKKMEQFLITYNAGQSFGYLLYRTVTKKSNAKLTIMNIQPNTYGLVLINGAHYVDVKSYNLMNIKLPQNEENSEIVVDILFENRGRVNYGKTMDRERQGLDGPILIANKLITDWRIYPLTFQPNYLKLSYESGIWKNMPPKQRMPILVRGTLSINTQPKDTFADMSQWGKGVLFVNGFNVGRYWSAGPQQTLYIPAIVLQMGVNLIIVFETGEISTSRTPTIKFVTAPILDKLAQL